MEAKLYRDGQPCGSAEIDHPNDLLDMEVSGATVTRDNGKVVNYVPDSNMFNRWLRSLPKNQFDHYQRTLKDGEDYWTGLPSKFEKLPAQEEERLWSAGN